MDIFTTALTRVLQTPIKPVRLRVKPLSKEPSLNKLTDDPDHLENHDQYVNLSKDHSEKKQNQQSMGEHQENVPSFLEGCVDGIESNTADDYIATVITHKEELIHPKKKDDEPDEDIHHLDLFV